MKKIILFLFLAISFVANAQVSKVIHNKLIIKK